MSSLAGLELAALKSQQLLEQAKLEARLAEMERAEEEQHMHGTTSHIAEREMYHGNENPQGTDDYEMSQQWDPQPEMRSSQQRLTTRHATFLDRNGKAYSNDGSNSSHALVKSYGYDAQDNASEFSAGSSGSSHPGGKIRLSNTPAARALQEKMGKRRRKLRELETPFLDHYSHKFLVYNQLLFSLGAMILLYLSLFHEQKAKFTRTFFYITIAAIAYYCKCSGLGDMTLFGHTVPMFRYIDWLITTPIMLSEVCTIGFATNHAWDMIVGSDILMLMCGIASALIPTEQYWTAKYTFFFCSCIFYVIMSYVLFTDVSQNTVKLATPHTQELFMQLEYLTFISWSFYPVVSILGRAHFEIISENAEDVLICVLDAVSKVGMEVLIVYYVLNDPGQSERWSGSTLANATAVAGAAHHL